MVRLFGAFSGRLLARRAAFAALCIAPSLGCATPQEYDVVPDGEAGSTGGQVNGVAGAAMSQGGAAPEAGSGNSAGADTAAGAPSSAGSASAGAPSGGSTGFAGSPGMSGAANGGGGTAGSGTAGMTNTAGSAGSGQAGSTGSAGSAGSTGGTGCAAPAWASGKTYKVGDVLTGVCTDAGGGATVCVVNKKYPWTCYGATCSIYAPGAGGWWSNWTVGTACN
jgi:hypothetical protein